MIGKTVSHYKIIEQLGAGGMGVVYKAEDTKLKRSVALKFLPQKLTSDPEAKERLIREAQAASALEHPNICNIHEISETDDGQLFIVMACYEGQTLKEKINSGPLPVDEAIDITIKIAQGLARAHEEGIVHRDIKPANIIITDRDEIKILDFGLAKLAGWVQLTKESSTLGTVAYMSPEQLRSNEVDQRTDIWSLGVILYEMLTGNLPFKGDYEQAIVYAILNEKPNDIQLQAADFSSELLHIINRSLEKNPDDRYQSINDMLIDLQRLQRDTQEISEMGTEIHKSDRAFKYINKYKKILLPLTLIIIITLSAIAYIIINSDSEKEYKRISIAVIDFNNETNETELNGLSGMLITALEQSKRLSVLTRSRMFDVLKQLDISVIEGIDESLGRRICKEANINTLAMATIRKFGKLYTIDFKVLNVDQNEYLFTLKEQSEGQENIPSMIDNLSDNVRKELKEKESEIKVNTANVVEITSPNLEAYQHYFKGEEYIDKLNFDLAKKEFLKAIELDTCFGLAYYRMAYAVNWELNPKESAKYIKKAIKNLNRIPEKEKYLTRALAVNLQDGQKAALSVLDEMEMIYPDDKEMLYNIGDWSYHVGELEKAKTYLEKVLSMDPVFIRALQHLIWAYRDLGMLEEMKTIAQRYLAVTDSDESYALLAEAYRLSDEFTKGLEWLKQVQLQNPHRYDLHRLIGIMYFLQDQYDIAEKEFKILIEKDKPAEIQQRGYRLLANFYPYVGKYNECIKICDQFIDYYWQIKDTSLACYWQLVKGWAKIHGWNDSEAGWREIEKTFQWKDHIDYIFYWTALPLMYIYHGNYGLADSLAATFDLDWGYITVQSMINSVKNECNTIESIDHTINQIPNGFAQILVLYHYSKCQYENGQLDQAEKYLKQIKHIYDTSFGNRATFYPKSIYLLGKVYQQKGEYKLARNNYKKFLEIWKNADEDLPELIDAKKRLAKLMN